MNIFIKRKLTSLKKQAQRLFHSRDQGENIDLSKEIALQNQLARFYDTQFDKDIPEAKALAFECYRLSASLGDSKAMYICGERLLEQGKFWTVFAEDSLYGNAVHKRYASNYFQEAFTYLQEAEEQGFPEAKRLRGLSYLHGWGHEVDQEKGFALVVKSIEDEKAWDRAKEIVEDLGLDSSEFFAKLADTKQSQS